jgi:hypothetical protein
MNDPNNTTEYVLAEWHVDFEPNAEPRVVGRNEVLVATVAGTDDEAFTRALLIARAPSLRSAANAALTVLTLIARHERGRAAAAANDLIPSLEAALWGLDELIETPS